MKFNFFSIQAVTALPRFGAKDEVDLFKQDSIIPHAGGMSIYINIPYCRTACRFCMLRKAAKIVNTVPDEFIEYLLKELKYRASDFSNNTIDSVYFGGGTPSLLSASQVSSILNCIYKNYSMSNNIELSFEGEAQSLNDADLLEGLKTNGINRISFGLQTMNQNLRDFLGRTDTISEIIDLKKKLDHLQFDDINVDYLYNLPFTNENFVEKDISEVISLGFTSIDCHPLKYISCSKELLNDIVSKKGELPTKQTRIQMFNIIKNKVEQIGMKEQMTDQYTLTNIDTTNLYVRQLNGLDGGQYAGFGPGARSHYGDYGLVNARLNHEYFAMIDSQKNAIKKKTYSTQLDNYITRFPKRNDVLLKSTIQKSEFSKHYFSVLDMLLINDYIIDLGNSFKLTRSGLNWYQNLQEVLLVPDQRNRHVESTKKRSEKLSKYNGYFDVIGKPLK
ncbi:radical SAM protein [Lutibacter sp.]